MKRSEWLQESIAVAKANLAKPNVCYQNGRMSHDVEHECLEKYEEELADMALDGYFNAYGQLVAYADQREEEF